MPQKEIQLEDDPLWYKDAIIYEVHVRAFYDGAGDGIGDFKGLTQKLDYIEDLGITAIWLLPFYPSPLKDDGYDISDYLNVHHDYGTLRDVKVFLEEAHRRGIRVITELVLNHTSNEHAWFQRARRADPASVWRNYYVWSDTPEKYKEARIIFKDFETSNWAWDPVAKAYYWHRFYSHQPDLNYDDPHVQKVILKVMDYWLSMGVDGLRFDAVPYLFEREGTNCENLPETYEFLKKVRAHIDGKFKNKMILAEANQWPEDAVAYFGHGDECHMEFHFPLMPRMFMAIRVEDRYPIIDILEQTPPIPDNCQWALFLRNHDELTLEMVTDEERDYMYRIYARDPKARINLGIRRRLAPLLGNDRRKIELMNVLLFSLPGTPVVYYGDEIGMGDNYYLGDRNGVRTPMQWSGDRNAGFSQANPQKLYLPVIIDPEYHYEAVNVENQERNQASLLWWMRHFIGMRKRFKAFGRGSIEFMLPDNSKVFAFVRQYQDEYILVVTNLSRHSQAVELDLSKFSGRAPEEVFSMNRFPKITNSPYMLTLGPYGYYWFLLHKPAEPRRIGRDGAIPELIAGRTWEHVLEGRARERLEEAILPAYVKECRWFGGKARPMQQLQIIDAFPIKTSSSIIYVLFLEIQYTEGLPEVYFLPLSFATEEKAGPILERFAQAVIARVTVATVKGIIYDAVYDSEFAKHLLWLIGRRHRIKVGQGELVAYPGKAFKDLAGGEELPIEGQVLRTEQSNTSILYRNKFFLKLYRRLDEGINPDLEIERFLTEKAPFAHAPPFVGAIEYRRNSTEPVVLGLLEGYIPNEGDAWTFTLDAVNRYFERVLARRQEIQEMPKAPASLVETAHQKTPPLLEELIVGVYLEMARLLGRRTAELHRMLASDTEDPDFAPEPFSVLYRRSIYQSMQSLAKRVLSLLEKSLAALPDEVRDGAKEIVNLRKKILDQFHVVLQKKISAMKIRVHGDYHLGQVLYTGKDFVIIDFEGEPARALSERRLKRSPLVDVAGMIRSFHYAAYSALLKHASVRREDFALLEPWTDLWYRYISGAFLKSYLDTTGGAPFIPANTEEFEILLRAFLLERAIYELGYELNNRPELIMIPIKGIKHLLEA
jgi:maltose alpha-D-glucosyltransferase/alpha-amylase